MKLIFCPNNRLALCECRRCSCTHLPHSQSQVDFARGGTLSIGLFVTSQKQNTDFLVNPGSADPVSGAVIESPHEKRQESAKPKGASKRMISKWQILFCNFKTWQFGNRLFWHPFGCLLSSNKGLSKRVVCKMANSLNFEKLAFWFSFWVPAEESGLE